MALINGVNFQFIKTDSIPCGGDQCPHYAIVVFMPVDRLNRRSSMFCLNHLLTAARFTHKNDKARKQWL